MQIPPLSQLNNNNNPIKRMHMRRSDLGPQPAGELTLQVIPLPKDSNSAGDIYGGWLVNQMDLAAANTANRIAQGRTATVAMERMEFISPVRVGSRVSVYTKLVDVGRSSLKIHVEVWTQNNNESHPRKVSDSDFVYVAIDENGCIRQVPRHD